MVRWLVSDGDPVCQGAKLVEVETDKAVVEIESPSDGILHIKTLEEALVDADAELAEILQRVKRRGLRRRHRGASLASNSRR